MNWPDYAMDEAIAAVLNGSPIRAAAAKFNVPSSSLHGRVSRRKFGKTKRNGDSSESVEHEISMVVPEKKRLGNYEVQDVVACGQEESVKSLESHASGRATSSQTLADMNDHATTSGTDIHPF